MVLISLHHPAAPLIGDAMLGVWTLALVGSLLGFSMFVSDALAGGA